MTAALSNVLAIDRKVGRAKPVAVAETPASLADRYGTLKALIAEIEAKAAPHVAELEAVRAKLVDLDRDSVDGGQYRVTVSHALRVSLDAKKIKADMSEAWVAAHSQSAMVTTVRVGGLLNKS